MMFAPGAKPAMVCTSRSVSGSSPLPPPSTASFVTVPVCVTCAADRYALVYVAFTGSSITIAAVSPAPLQPCCTGKSNGFATPVASVPDEFVNGPLSGAALLQLPLGVEVGLAVGVGVGLAVGVGVGFVVGVGVGLAVGVGVGLAVGVGVGF